MLTLRDYCRDHWHASAVSLRSMAHWVPVYAAVSAVLFLLLVAMNGEFRTENWYDVLFYGAIYAFAVYAFRGIALIMAGKLDDR